ncbi:MAG TPA: TIGR03067 domain-containing protein [Urbifossiella sp.]|jgi:uncharacterized protein (TIGR03067 family)|nr:TIGR03067 domain-containing protein [Urbifossiella sp.]
MKRLMAAVAAGLVVVAAGSAQPGGAAKSIDGTYAVVSATRGGKAEDKKLDTAEFVFKDGKLVISDGGKKEETAEYKLDPAKTPAHIDIMPARGKTDTVQGIYQTKSTTAGLELLIAFARDGKERPTDFKGDEPDTVVLKLLRKGGK